MAQFYGSITDMVIKTTLGKMATLKYTAAPQSLTFTYTSWPRVDTSTTDRNYSYRTGNFPPTTGNANFLITNGSGILQNIWNISERGQYKEVLKYNNMSIRIMIDNDNVGCDIQFYNTNTNGEFMHYRISYAAAPGYTPYNAAAIVFFTVVINGNTYYMPAIISTTSDYFYIEGVTYYMQHYSAPIEAPVYNWQPFAHLAGNSGQFQMDLFQVKAQYIGDGETQNESSDTSHFVLSQQASFSRLAANLLDGEETVVAYCGDNYMTFTRASSVENDHLFISVTAKLYFRSGTPVYTMPTMTYQADLTVSDVYLSFIVDTAKSAAAPDLVRYFTDGSVYRYNMFSLPVEQDLSEIYIWLQDNGQSHEGTYDTGTTDDGGEPGTPRPQDHIGPGTLPTLGGLNNGLVTLYLPSDAQMTQIAQFLWSDNVLDNFKKYFNNFADNILSCYVLPYTPASLPTKAFKVGNMQSDTITAVPYTTTRAFNIPMGSINIEQLWGSYLDFAPYTKAEIYLPYLGIHSLDIDEIMCPTRRDGSVPAQLGTTLTLEYWLDVLTGVIVAKLYVRVQTRENGGYVDEVRYQFSGKVGYNIPLTGQTYASMVQGIITGGAGLISTIATGGLTAPMAAASVVGTIQASKPSVERIGNISGDASMLASDTPYLILSSPNKPQLVGQGNFTGFPSYKRGTLTNFTGYCEVLECHVEGMSATDTEKEMILSLLKAGVII